MVVPKGPGLHTEPPELVPGVSHQDKGFHGQSLCVCVCGRGRFPLAPLLKIRHIRQGKYVSTWPAKGIAFRS